VRVSPTAAVTVDGLNASLASAPTVMGISLARVRGRRRERRVVGMIKCMFMVGLMGVFRVWMNVKDRKVFSESQVAGKNNKDM